MANNVITFPKTKQPIAEEENCDQIVDIAVEQVMTVFSVYYDHCVDDRDIGLIVEAVRSKVYRDHNLHHPLQQLAEQLITLVD